MRYIYGPVPSRRLGKSLGVDLVPLKTCTLSCRYCQIGNTPSPTLFRKPWVPLDDVLDELRKHLDAAPHPDRITFSGSGEPTLNSEIGAAIRAVKRMTDIPVCVITNGTLLWIPEVRDSLLEADTVMPSLDSAIEKTFRKLCRPHPDLTITRIIEGLQSFRESYAGAIWLEILFVKDYNDTDQEIEALVEAASRIQPDAIHLNTVVRPPADSTVEPVLRECLEEIRDRFGVRAEIIASFREHVHHTVHTTADDVREYLKRRPGDADSITRALGAERSDVDRILTLLQEAGDVRCVNYQGKQYWEYCR
ncbi:radical SAM protein [Candidatus Latescibacterota bacterium]